MVHTKRLTLNSYRDEDEEKVIDLLTHEEIKKTYMIPDFTSREQAVQLFQRIQRDSNSKDHYERGIYLGQELIGWINDVGREGTTIELGYVIDPNYHNQGYATEVLGAAIQDLFEHGFTKVLTGAFEQNIASCRVMEKCGMKRISQEDDIEYHGKVQHCIYYSIQK